MTVNAALAALALESVAEQVTLVRPSLKRVAECGPQVTGTEPSTASHAVTLKAPRTRLTHFRTRTVFADAAPDHRRRQVEGEAGHGQLMIVEGQ